MFGIIGIGVAALAGLSLLDDVVNKINETTKPVYDFFEEREKEALLVATEDLNWKSTMNLKNTKIRNDVIREQNNIKKPKYTSIKNNSNDVCELIYIDKLRISPEQLNINNLERKDIRRSIKLGVDNTIILINEEFKVYNILLYVDNKFRLVKNEKIIITVIPIKDLQIEEVDLGCKFRFGL